MSSRILLKFATGKENLCDLLIDQQLTLCSFDPRLDVTLLKRGLHPDQGAAFAFSLSPSQLRTVAASFETFANRMEEKK